MSLAVEYSFELFVWKGKLLPLVSNMFKKLNSQIGAHGGRQHFAQFHVNQNRRRHSYFLTYGGIFRQEKYWQLPVNNTKVCSVQKTATRLGNRQSSSYIKESQDPLIDRT